MRRDSTRRHGGKSSSSRPGSPWTGSSRSGGSGRGRRSQTLPERIQALPNTQTPRSRFGLPGRLRIHEQIREIESKSTNLRDSMRIRPQSPQTATDHPKPPNTGLDSFPRGKPYYYVRTADHRSRQSGLSTPTRHLRHSKPHPRHRNRPLARDAPGHTQAPSRSPRERTGGPDGGTPKSSTCKGRSPQPAQGGRWDPGGGVPGGLHPEVGGPWTHTRGESGCG